MQYNKFQAPAGAQENSQYAIHSSQFALSHCFRNEKSRARYPTLMAREIARLSWRIIRTANGIAESVGGVSDHVHILVGLRATHCLADVLRELKSVSSGWLVMRFASVILRGRKAMVVLR